MANSRYDNIKVFYNGEFNIPQQIKVYNGSSWVDLGAKDSYNTNKLNVNYNNNFICATYARHDVNVPKAIQVGSGSKYLDIYNSNSTVCFINNYVAGWNWEMVVEVNETTPLYTCFARNNNDINQSYINYIADVSGDSVRLRLRSGFHGRSASTGKYVEGTYNNPTDYCWAKGEKVKIVVHRNSTNGNENIKIYNASGTLLNEFNIYEISLQSQVNSPVYHRIGSETLNYNGDQSVYGNARVYSLKFTPTSDRSKQIQLNIAGASNGATRINSSGNYSGFADSRNTSVYGANYAEYIRQTI